MRKKNLRTNLLSLLMILSLSLVIAGCASTNPCPEQPAIGNTGSILNTGKDDYLPVVYGDTLYFTSIREDINKKEQIYKSIMNSGAFTSPVLDTSLPINKLADASSPAFYENSATGQKEVYFAAVAPKDKSKNRNIFISKFINGAWTFPELVGNNISTKSYESQPAITRDGSILLFSSDRTGGIGQIDLYLSRRQPDGSWSEPQNLGKGINTENSEMSPFIDEDGILYFASKGYSQKTGYDIIKAVPDGKGLWTNPKPMLFPINTEEDESGPTIWKDKLILSSNRRGGCGGYDIYSFDLCGPVFVDGQVEAQGWVMPFKGKIELIDSDGKVQLETSTDDSGKFSFNVTPKEKYNIRYTNECMPEFPLLQPIEAPCSDTTTVRLVVKISLPEEMNQFSFEKYNVPFFVSGYYIPNTTENLESLRLKFNYNLLGTSDTTHYIENPGTKYDQYASVVEQALSDAVDFILKKCEYLRGSCATGSETILIKVSGYADPRLLSDLARYDGASIDDPDVNIKVMRGEPMTNELLSSLRAYYTMKQLITILEKKDNYEDLIEKINWQIEGKGIDEESSLANEFKRRVDIKIQIKL